jgi:hypothetical protein
VSVANSLSMSASVGADIESLCSKCGDVWHVVVAKVGPEIVKVQCKECGGYHRYRKPGHVAGARKPRAPAAASPARRATSSGAGRSPGRASSAPSSSAAVFRPDMSAPTRPYTMRETFRPGEQISHPRFGVGLVEQSSEPGKMAVLFADGRRILAQAKPASTLGTAEHMAVLTPEGED